LMINIIIIIIFFNFRFLKQNSNFFLSVINFINESITIVYEIIEDEN